MWVFLWVLRGLGPGLLLLLLLLFFYLFIYFFLHMMAFFFSCIFCWIHHGGWLDETLEILQQQLQSFGRRKKVENGMKRKERKIYG